MPAPKKRSLTREEVVQRLLEDPFWLDTLHPEQLYSRLHDDHDGSFQGRLNITFTPDGDAWVSMDNSTSVLRFRSELGGGYSPRTRRALLILAEAMRLDNEQYPVDVEPRPTR